MAKIKIKFIILLLFLSIPVFVKAQDASLYLSPSSGSFLVGSTFSVSVFLNTNDNKINVVWAELKFPSNILQVTSPTAGSSFITNWLTPPNYSNERGIISFRGGIPGGISTSAGLVSTITFRAIASGVAKIDFTGDSKILLNDGKGTDILTNTINGEYQILVPPPEGPKVFSPTHPDPNLWYSDSSPSFSWETEDEVSGFSWSFSQNPQERPDGKTEGNETVASFNNVSDGIWYFHIREEKNEIWGKTTHVQVKIDVSPPKEFTPKVVANSRLIGYQTMLYFETTDEFSGIDHYEVGIVGLNEATTTPSFLTEEVSPYKIPYQSAGKYSAIIKAIDKAGNIRKEEVNFRLVTPFITHIQGKGLEIENVFFPWWLIIIILLILFLAFGVLFWRIIGKKRGKET